MNSSRLPCSIGLVAFLALWAPNSYAERRTKPRDATVCEIAERPKVFDGKFVRVKAAILVGFEVSAIGDPMSDCERLWFTYPDGSPTASVSLDQITATVRRPPVKLEKDEHFKQFVNLLNAKMYPRDRGTLCQDCHRYKLTARIVGRVDLAEEGSGYGYLNAYSMRFVLQSVEELWPEDLSPSYDSKLFSPTPVRFPTAYLVGSVVGPAGEPVRFAPVAAMSTEQVPLNLRDSSARTDHEGKYHLEIPPGRYIIGVNIVSSPTLRVPFPPTYYPGTTQLGNAHEVVLLDHQRSRIDLRLGTKLTERTFLVQVMWPDGKTAADANVWLSDTRRPWQVLGGSVSQTDPAGKTFLKGFEGIDYLLHANIYAKPSRTPHCAETVALHATDPMQDRIVLVLTRTGEVCRGGD